MVTLKVWLDPKQGTVDPDITDGCAGTVVVVTASKRAVPLPQVLEGVTCIFPPVTPTVTVIVLVPCPAVIVHPAGTDQVKVVPAALVTL